MGTKKGNQAGDLSLSSQKEEMGFFLLLFHQQRKLNLLWVHHETFK